VEASLWESGESEDLNNILGLHFSRLYCLPGYWFVGDAGSDDGSKFILLSTASDFGSNARNQMTAQTSIRQALSSTRCKEIPWWQIRKM
jgi:hypothetical protein